MRCTRFYLHFLQIQMSQDLIAGLYRVCNSRDYSMIERDVKQKKVRSLVVLVFC